MLFNMKNYEYRINDKVRNTVGAEFIITDISSTTRGSTKHYRLANTCVGVTDSPFWINSHILYSYYSPVSEMVKILFANPPR